MTAEEATAVVAPLARKVNRLCRAGLGAGAVLFTMSVLATATPCFIGGVFLSRIWDKWGLNAFMFASACEISLAGAVIGLCAVGIRRVKRSKGGQSGIEVACGGIAFGLATIGVSCFRWLFPIIAMNQ